MDYDRMSIPDVVVIKPTRHRDSRGFFSEVFNVITSSIVQVEFVQDNHSLSILPGTLRGLHFQRPPCEQGKLVRVVQGRIFDVAVDLRIDSITYMKHVGVMLSRENWHQLWIPPGFAHGFLTLEPNTEVIYKVTKPYSKDHDAGIRWDDPELSIPWPNEGFDFKLSERDSQLPPFSEVQNPWANS